MSVTVETERASFFFAQLLGLLRRLRWGIVTGLVL